MQRCLFLCLYCISIEGSPFKACRQSIFKGNGHEEKSIERKQINHRKKQQKKKGNIYEMFKTHDFDTLKVHHLTYQYMRDLKTHRHFED